MKIKPAPWRFPAARLGWLPLLAVLACTREQAAPREAAERGYVTVAHDTQAAWIKNFNPFLATSRFPTRSGIYEPLVVYNVVKGEWAHFLAERHEFRRENRALVFDLRHDVLWSDGKPFTAKDVIFTFELLKKHSALDRIGVRKFLHRFRALDEDTVEFEFDEPSATALSFIGHQPIVPEHVWREIADPIRFMNEDPIATGPFTEIEIFRSQLYQIGKNPRYWQKGKPYVSGLRYPAYSANESATLALLEGEIDWAGLFVPAVDRIFVDRDPEHFRRWFPLIEGTVLLYANTTRKPFDDVRVRKALSQAIDRELMTKAAMFNYTRPSDASALSDAYARWRSPEPAGDWVRYDPESAQRLLDEAGYPLGAGGYRLRPDGVPLSFEVNVVDGWTDWVRACQIIARGLSRVGVATKVKQYSWGAFYDKLSRGDFDLSIGWSFVGPTPYDFYVHVMAGHTVKPVGESSDRNWHRFHARGVDELLEAFNRSSAEAEQQRLARELQRLFVEQAPVIPLFPGPQWGEYNSRYFVGFPDEKNPYAPLAPFVDPGALLLMTEIRPRNAPN